MCSLALDQNELGKIEGPFGIEHIVKGDETTQVLIEGKIACKLVGIYSLPKASKRSPSLK